MTDPRRACLPVVLEALLRLEERQQVPAPTRTVRAVLTHPIMVRCCAVLEVAQGDGLVTFTMPEPGVHSGWDLTEAGRAQARAARS